MSNINDSYFDGYYKDIWKSIIPAELTPREVNFMLTYFKLQPGNRVLDLMCGYGRHAIALAKAGMDVTAVDNLTEYIDEINKTRDAEKLQVTTIRQSIIDYKPKGQFELVICMGNSLNFFDSNDVMKIFSMVSSCLVTGGHLLINSWSLAEIVFRSFKESNDSNHGGMEFRNHSKMLFHPTRMETATTIIAPDGQTENKSAIDYIYSINEIEAMLKNAGLTLKEVFSIPGKKTFSLGEPRAYIVAGR